MKINYLIFLVALFFAPSAWADELVINRINDNTVEVIEVKEDIVKTYSNIDIEKKIQEINNNIQGESNRCQYAIKALEKDRDALMTVSTK